MVTERRTGVLEMLHRNLNDPVPVGREAYAAYVERNRAISVVTETIRTLEKCEREIADTNHCLLADIRSVLGGLKGAASHG